MPNRPHPAFLHEPKKMNKLTAQKLTKPKKMSNWFSLFLISPLLLISITTSLQENSNNNTFMWQVVDDTSVCKTLNEDPLLGAEHHFLLFKKYGKSYANQKEHELKFKVFQKNLKRVRRHRRFDPLAIHDMTKFSDLTCSKFKRTILGLRGSRRWWWWFWVIILFWV